MRLPRELDEPVGLVPACEVADTGDRQIALAHASSS
jgi:hypothetical protein